MSENPQDQPAHPDPQQPYAGQPAPPGQFPGQAPAYGYSGQQAVSPADARMWSLFAHLGGTFLSFLVPLVIYLVYKDRDPFIRGHSAQALNFHITLFIVYVVSIPLMFILIGFFTLFAAAICAVVFSIMAAIAANNGQEYTYPLVPKMIT